MEDVPMLLDREQKAIFCRWLENEIHSTGGIIEQMKKINTPDAVTKRMQIQKAGCEIVLRMLQASEEVSISRTDSASSKP
jgi:uncharacterized protein YacL (UPF0231 family)